MQRDWKLQTAASDVCCHHFLSARLWYSMCVSLAFESKQCSANKGSPYTVGLSAAPAQWVLAHQYTDRTTHWTPELKILKVRTSLLYLKTSVHEEKVACLKVHILFFAHFLDGVLFMCTKPSWGNAQEQVQWQQEERKGREAGARGRWETKRWMKRGQRQEIEGQDRRREQKKNKAWFSGCSWLSALHMPAGNLFSSLTLSAYLRTIITCANSTRGERQKGREGERQWAQRWPKHISGGNHSHPDRVYAAKSINFQPFFCPTQHAIKQESRLWHCLSNESVHCISPCSSVHLLCCFSLSASSLRSVTILLPPVPCCPFQFYPLFTFLFSLFSLVPTLGGFRVFFFP